MTTLKSGRSGYEAAEERAIITYVKKYGKETGTLSIKGNALYKQMEKEKVTKHPWQSMKSKYLKYLSGESSQYAFRQLIVAKSKGKDLTVLMAPSTEVHNAECDSAAGTGNSLRRETLKRERDISASREPEVKSRRITFEERTERLLKYLRTEDGLKKLKLINFHREMREIMAQHNMSFKETREAIMSVNGNIDEAKHLLKHGKMIDGTEPWTPEEDNILKCGDEKQVQELLKNRGVNSVTNRINYLV